MKETVKIRTWNHKIQYSFKQWCDDNNRQDILIRWDTEMNGKSPDEVSYKSNKKYWFKCPCGKHESELKNIQYLPVHQKEMPCIKCNSFAQMILDKYDSHYLNKLESINEGVDFWSIPQKCNKKYNIVCYNNPNHIYMQALDKFAVNGCPYCAHHTEKLDVKIDPKESVGHYYAKAIERWSDKNNKTPYEYYPNSSAMVWWKCENNKHTDYQRKICNSLTLDFRCPQCAIDNISYYDSEGHGHNWQGGKTAKNKLARMTPEYDKWREDIFKRDNYTCQCCGKTGARINAHHIYSFANYPDLRTDLSNGICLCVNCHDSTISGSFHNLYGTLDPTPAQLETYINEKRKQLGIDIPFSIKAYNSGDRLSPTSLLHADSLPSIS